MPSTARKAPPTKKKITATNTPSVIQEEIYTSDTEERLEYIAKAAYYRAQSRGFVPGEELDDWLEAEAEFEEMQVR